jgi:molecular chaperone GrpE
MSSETSRADQPAEAEETIGEAATGGPPAAGGGDSGAPPDSGAGAEPGADSGSAPPAGSERPRSASGADSDTGATSAQPGAEASEDPGALDQLLAEARRERDEYLELAQRARADFENFRKRAARDSAEAEQRGLTTLAKGLVPVLDNLERALHSAGIEPAGAATDPPTDHPADSRGAEGPAGVHEALARGLALVHRELRATLERAGIESYDPAGERFDPEWHEALATRAGDGTESGIVVETLERGYRIAGQALRPARVVVSE